MAFVYIFKLPRGTKEQYDTVINKLEERGLGQPSGRMYHFAGPMKDGWQVTDIWQTKEQYEAFQKELTKLLEELNIPMPHIDMSSAEIILKEPGL